MNQSQAYHFIGLDIHKCTISFCEKSITGQTVAQGTIPARKQALVSFAQSRTRPFIAGIEATLFSGWVYDALGPLCHRSERGASRPAQGNFEEQGRSHRRRDTGQSLAGGSVSVMLHGFARGACVAPGIALPQFHGRRSDAHEEQSGGHSDGNRCRVSRDETAPEEVLLGTTRQSGRGSGLGTRAAENDAHEHRAVHECSISTARRLDAARCVTYTRLHCSRQCRASASGLCSAQHESGGKERRAPLSKERNPYLQSILIEVAKLAPSKYLHLGKRTPSRPCSGIQPQPRDAGRGPQTGRLSLVRRQVRKTLRGSGLKYIGFSCRRIPPRNDWAKEEIPDAPYSCFGCGGSPKRKHRTGPHGVSANGCLVARTLPRQPNGEPKQEYD